MKRLFLVIVAAVVAYSGWWFYAANAFQSDVEAWFEDLRSDGWEATYSDIAVRGFPSRTDLTLTNPVLRAPESGFGWQAPFFQVLGLSYQSGHVIVAWPDTQTIETPDGPIHVISDGLRASVITDSDLIVRTNVEASVLNFEGPSETVAIAGLNAALEKVEPSVAGYRLAVAVDGIAVSDPAITGSGVPDALAKFRTDTVVELDEPLRVTSAAQTPPNLNTLTVRNTQVDYGALTLKLGGEIDFDVQGLASGEVTFEADNWRDALATAQDRGDLPPALTEGIAELLSLFASLSGSRDALDVTLGLDGGTVLLGPLPIGRVPPLPRR